MATAKLDVLLSFRNKLGGINQATAGLANVAKGIAGIAAAYVSYRAVVGGMKDIIGLGGQLSDLSTQTGISVSGILKLQQAFQDAGVGAEKVGASVSKMQKALIDAADNAGGEQARAFKTLGLNVDELLRLAPDEQFRVVADAIGGIDNQSEKAATAMRIFGRSGAELLNVFATGVLEDAEKSLGKMPAVMERNANQLDRVSDLLGRIPNKSRQVFAGIADEIGDLLQAPLEAIDKMDFTGAGQTIGAYINLWKDAIANGGIGEMLEVSLGAGWEAALSAFKSGLQSLFSADALGIAIGISVAITKGTVNAAASVAMLMSTSFRWAGESLYNSIIWAAKNGIAYLVAGFKYAAQSFGDALSNAAALGGVQIAESDAARTGDIRAIQRAADFRKRVEDEIKAKRDANWQDTLAKEKATWGANEKLALPDFAEIASEQKAYFDEGRKGFSELLDGLTEDARATLGLASAKKTLGDETKTYTERLTDMLNAQKDATEGKKAGPAVVGSTPVGSGDQEGKTGGRKERTIGQGFSDALTEYKRKVGSLGDQFYEMTSSVSQSIQSGIGGSIEGLINRTMTWGDALRNIGSTILSSVVTAIAQMGAKWITTQLVMFALGQKLKAADSASTAAKGATDAAAMAPAAAMASISSFGAAALVGIAALVAGMAIAGAFADGSDGRLTGPGTSRSDSMLAAVSPGEAILNDRASAWLGDSKIRELNQTGKMAGGRTSPTVVTGAAPQVNIAMLDGKRQVQGFLESARGQRYLYNMATRQMRTA